MTITAIPDFYDVDALRRTEQEKAFRQTVRDWVDRECLPIIAEHFDRGTFPMHLIPRMAALGLFGLHVKGFGCLPQNETTYGLACQELGRCDSGLRAMMSVQNSLVMFPIDAFGSDAQRRRWLRKSPGARSSAVS